MNRKQRILIEIFSPPLLGAAIFTVGGFGSDTLVDRIMFFPFFLVFAYLYGILPTAAYAAVMELWFTQRLHIRCGLLGTTVVSSLLGLGAGFLIQLMAQGAKISSLLPIGALVGLVIGLYLARKSRKNNELLTETAEL